jgi:N-methylhydantoinase A/oxoprolinase/acetone carboxylase beta subunit
MTLPFSPVFSAYGASTADVRHRYEVRADQYDAQALRARAERDMRGEGFAAGEIEVEVLRFQRDGTEWVALEATRELPHVELARIAAVGADAATEPEGSCEVRWPDVGVLTTPVHSRARLGTGTELRGPALVDSATTTCAVPPGWTLLVDEHGAERLSFHGRGQA